MSNPAIHLSSMTYQPSATEWLTPYYERLQQFLNGSDPLLMLIGEAGSGKTSLLNELIERSTPHQNIIRIKGNEELNANRLADILAAHWDIPTTNKPSRLENELQTLLLELTEKQQQSVLVIDDAQRLSYTVLAALVHLSTQQDHTPVYLHIILSGRPLLKERIASLVSKNRVIPRIFIGALSRQDAQNTMLTLLAEYRCHSALISTDRFNRLYQQSGGLPDAFRQSIIELIHTIRAESYQQSRAHWRILSLKPILILAVLTLAVSAWHLHYHRGPGKPSPLRFSHPLGLSTEPLNSEHSLIAL